MLDPKGLIKKANLTFTTKIYWLLIHHRLSPMATNNILTLDRALVVASLVAGLEIDFVKLLILVIHERTFKSSTTYPFVCLIFHLFRDARVPVWHYDTLQTQGWTVDIGLIRDKGQCSGTTEKA